MKKKTATPPPEETKVVSKSETKRKNVMKGGAPALTPAQRVAAKLKANKKLPFTANVIFDPNEPIASATHWIRMPHPWNKLTGTIGIPLGHVTVIQGKPDSGKTTVGMHGMVEGQNEGYNVVLIDTEHKFNWKRLANMGADLTNVLPIECETIEDGFEAIENTIDLYAKENPGVPTIFLWDSLGQTPTDEEMRGTARSHTVASAAKVIKKNIRRLRSKIKRSNAAIIFINQVYDNINALFGNSTKGYGGNGAYYAAVLVIEVQRIRNKEKITQKNGQKTRQVIGLISGMKCTKNHLSDVQGAKAEALIGPRGIDQETVKDLDTEDIDSLADDDDDSDLPPPPKMKGKKAPVVDDDDEDEAFAGDEPAMKNGREASL